MIKSNQLEDSDIRADTNVIGVVMIIRADVVHKINPRAHVKHSK